MRPHKLMDQILANSEEIKRRLNETNSEARNKSIEYFLDNILDNTKTVIDAANTYKRNEFFYIFGQDHKASERYGAAFSQMSNLADNLRKLGVSLYASEDLISRAHNKSESNNEDLAFIYDSFSLRDDVDEALIPRYKGASLVERMIQVHDYSRNSPLKQRRHRVSHIASRLLLTRASGPYIVAKGDPHEGEIARDILDSAVRSYLELTNDFLEAIVRNNSGNSLSQRSHKDKRENKNELRNRQITRSAHRIAGALTGLLLGGVSATIDNVKQKDKQIGEDQKFKTFISNAYIESAEGRVTGMAKANFYEIKSGLLERGEFIDRFDEDLKVQLGRCKFTDTNMPRELGESINNFYEKQKEYLERMPKLSLDQSSPEKIIESIGRLEEILTLEKEVISLKKEISEEVLKKAKLPYGPSDPK